MLGFHGSMLRDERRTEAFLRAITAAVGPGDVVLDIGCGTGILSFFSCLAGAERVFAVEQGPVLQVARELCAANGFADRVEFVEGWSTEVDLPGPVDVIVSETIGNAGLEEGIARWVSDARRRFLRPGGIIIPESVTVMAAPVQSPYDAAEVTLWSEELLALDFSPVRAIAARQLWATELSPANLLTEPVGVGTVLLRDADEADLAPVVARARRTGSAHGIGVWFRAVLGPGVEIDNEPGDGSPSWSHVFLPLEDPIAMSKGDEIRLDITTNAEGKRWSWSVSTADMTSPMFDTAHAALAPPTDRRRPSTGDAVTAGPINAGPVNAGPINH